MNKTPGTLGGPNSDHPDCCDVALGERLRKDIYEAVRARPDWNHTQPKPGPTPTPNPNPNSNPTPTPTPTQNLTRCARGPAGTIPWSSTLGTTRVASTGSNPNPNPNPNPNRPEP